VQVSSYPSSPHSRGTVSSFYRTRGDGLQSCRMALMRYIWRHGAHRCGVDGCPGESHFWQASWRVMCLSRSGWRGSFSFGHHPYAGSRVGLTEGWRMHSGGYGGVPSFWAPTVPGMTLQCQGWWRSDGDGGSRPEVTEETCSAGLTSRHRPGRARGRWSYRFLGFHRPLLRSATWRRYGSERHSVVELTPAFPNSSRTALGMAAQRGLVEQRRNMIPKRC
jgi:hypothetical protein